MASRSDDDAVAKIEENLWSMWGQFGRARDCELHESPEALWFETPIPVQPYNMVVRFHGSGRFGSERSTASLPAFAERNVPFVWMVHPTAAPADLGERLTRRGYAEVEELMGMIADIDDVPPPAAISSGGEIVEVTPEHELATYSEFMAARWHVPPEARIHVQSILDMAKLGVDGSPNRAWIAVRDGLALSKTVTHESPGVIGLYGTATREQARGLGLGREVCLHALAAARLRGHRTAILHATPMAISLYEKIGFRPVAPIKVFTAPGSFYA